MSQVNQELQQIQFLKNQATILKARVFDAEELVKQQEQTVQNFLNEISLVLGKEKLSMQEVYDYIVSTIQDQAAVDKEIPLDSKKHEHSENSEHEVITEE